MRAITITAAVLAAAGLAALTLAAAGSVKTLPPPSPACRQWQVMSGPLEAALKDAAGFSAVLSDDEAALVARDEVKVRTLAVQAWPQPLGVDMAQLAGALRQLLLDNNGVWPSHADVLNVPSDADMAGADATGADMDCQS